MRSQNPFFSTISIVISFVEKIKRLSKYISAIPLSDPRGMGFTIPQTPLVTMLTDSDPSFLSG